MKRFILLTMASSTLMVSGLAVGFTGLVSAGSITGFICQGADNAATGEKAVGGNAAPCTSDNGNSAGQKIAVLSNQIVNIFSVIVGAIAVIMIIYGGFRYITSGGDSGNVSTAKNTLIYAIVGLIIVALAQLIVHLVLNQTAKAAA